MKSAANSLVWFGESVKAVTDDGKVGGYLVKFSDADAPDLSGEFFTAKTDFAMLSDNSATYYQHGLDPTLGRKMLPTATLKVDDVGVWAETQLDLRNAYEKAIFDMVKSGKMGWSSGTAAHLVEKEECGKAVFIKRWPLGLDASLTPTPCEPCAAAVPLKSLTAVPLATKSEGFSMADRLKLIEEAIRADQPDGEYWWFYICDLFDASVVYRREEGSGPMLTYERPYSFNDGKVTLGAPELVVRRTVYESVSGKSMPFADHSESVLAAVKGLAIRAREIKALRNSEDRQFSPERLDQIKGIAGELAQFITEAAPPVKAMPEAVQELALAELALSRKQLQEFN